MFEDRDPVYVRDTVERRYEVYSYWKNSILGYKMLAATFAAIIGIVIILMVPGLKSGRQLLIAILADIIFALIVYFFEPFTLIFLFGFSVILLGAPVYGLCWLLGVQPIGLRVTIGCIAGALLGAFMIYHYFDAKRNTAWSSRINHPSGRWD